MVTRSNRLADFVTDGRPEPERLVEVLCTDHVGTYVLPFPCRYEGGFWLNSGTGERIEADVVGWRALPVEGCARPSPRITARSAQPWPDP